MKFSASFCKKSVAYIHLNPQINYMTRIIFSLSSILLFYSLSFGLAERDFRSKNGQVIRGTILKYYPDGDVLIKRSKDLQQFRIDLSIFTEDDQAFVKNNFPPNHEALPEFKATLPSGSSNQCSLHR